VEESAIHGHDNTNVVKDNNTGLQWARNANLFGAGSWSNAITNCTGLVYGGYSDWRLPNVNELASIMRWEDSDPCLPNTAGTGQWTANDPFINVQTHYWTSTVYPYLKTSSSMYVLMSAGKIYYNSRAWTVPYVWPVRGP